jgi:transcriptional regulator with XRE-family HTH domain
MAPPRPSPLPGETFGERLRRFRLAKGLTQLGLGQRLGISKRMVAYYEIQGGTPAPDLLVKLADALDVTTDTLSGRKPGARQGPLTPESLRLWRRVKRIEELPLHDRKAILKMIDAMAESVSRRKAS